MTSAHAHSMFRALPAWISWVWCWDETYRVVESRLQKGKVLAFGLCGHSKEKCWTDAVSTGCGSHLESDHIYPGY